MSQYIINTGNIANDGQGDPLRTAFTDTNLNFNQIWAAGPVNSNITIANNTILTTNTNGNLILATNGIGAIIAAQSVVPDLSNVRMVGGPNNRFNTVYSQYLDISGIVTAGNLSVSGNLYVAGNTVTVNQSNLSVSNTLITLAANATIPVEADGGGIFIAGANASLTYSSSLNSWVSNIALSVQGNVSADYFVGDGSGLSNLNVSVDANTLTGNRLNSGVVFSNLTTVGTLTSLTVDGNVLAGNITATFYGDGSNLSNLGNVGNAVYATFAGTAATANLAAEAVTAINADTALYAVNANTANTANFALTSNCAIYADTATTAILANSAIVANVALFAQSVGVLANLSVTGNIVTGGILTNNYYYANGTPFAGGGGSGSIIQSPTAPLNPTASTLWWDEVSGRLYVYYDDGTSSQWVDAAPAGIGGGGSGTASLIQSPTAPLNPTANTLWWDEVSGRLYVYYDDGVTTQWVDASPAGTGSGSSGNIDLTNVSSNIIPSANLVYSLGNATNQWKDLWVSGNTIYINSVPITVDGATLQVDGANVITATGASNVSVAGNVTADYFIGDGSQLTGVVTSTGNIGFSGDAIYDLNGIYLENADLSHAATAAVVLPANGDANAIQVNNTYGNIALQTGAGSGITASWTFDDNGNLTLPGNSSSINYANGQPYGGSGSSAAAGNAGDIQINVAGNIGADSTLRYVDNGGEMTLYADYLNAPGIFTSDIYAGNGTPSNITLTTSYGNAAWTFDTNGNLTVPANGTIRPLTNDLTLDASGGNVYVKSKGHTFLFDANGVGRFVMPNNGKIAADSNLSINVGDWANSSGSLWTFDSTGNLTLPAGSTINNDNGDVIVNTINPNISVNTILNASYGIAIGTYINQPTTALFGTGMTVDYTVLDYVTGNIASVSINNPGLGYSTGDQITIPVGIPVSGAIFDITVSAPSTETWTFGQTGELYTPQGGRLGSAGKGWTGLDGGYGNPVSLTSYYANGFYAGCITNGSDGTINISTYTGNGLQGSWTFDNTGTLNVGGNIISGNLGNPMYITGSTANADNRAGSLILSGGSAINGIGGLPSAGGTLVLNGGSATGCATAGGSVLINAGAGDGGFGNITLTVNSKSTLLNEAGQAILPSVKIGTENSYDPGNPYEGEQLGLYGTRRIISPNSGGTNQVTVSTIIQSPQFGSPQVVYTAYNANVWAFKMTMRIQHGAGTSPTPQNMQMADIFAARNDAGVVTYSVTNRLKTDPTEDDVVIVPDYDPIYGTMFINATVTNSGTAANGSYYFTFDVAEFNQTYD